MNANRIFTAFRPAALLVNLAAIALLARSHWTAQTLGHFSRRGLGGIDCQVVLVDGSVFAVRSKTTWATGSSGWYWGRLPLSNLVVNLPGGTSAHSLLGFRTATVIHGPWFVRNIPPPVAEVTVSSWLIVSPWLAWLIVSTGPMVWLTLFLRRPRDRGRGFPAIQTTPRSAIMLPD
jgi:hypothetical protein